MNIIKKTFLALLVIISLMVSGFVIWGSTPMQPMPEALNALQSSAQVSVRTTPWLEFTPAGAQPRAGLILYPGARVDPRAYAPMARAIAESGYLVVVPQMPLNFAIFGADKADAIIAAHPEISQWVLSGHSLGGVMASTYARQNPQRVKGLILLAAYPAGSDDLSQSDLKVSSIFASLDGLATPDKVTSARPLLPPTTDWVEITGGNHAQFGWYGEQPGDQAALISRQAQQEQLVSAALQLLASLNKDRT